MISYDYFFLKNVYFILYIHTIIESNYLIKKTILNLFTYRLLNQVQYDSTGIAFKIKIKYLSYLLK